MKSHSTPREIFTKSPSLVAFLEDQPFDVFAQHSISGDEPKTYVCLKTPRIDEHCPLCEIANLRAKNVFAFNIAVLPVGTLSSLNCNVLCTEADFIISLKRATNLAGNKLATAGYWSISVREIKSKPDYIFSHVRPSDLENRWGLDPDQVAASLRELQLFDYTVVEVSEREELMEVARKLASES